MAVRDFLAHDPRPALARINVPVLAITGGQGVQVPPQDVAAIGRLVQGPFEGHVAGVENQIPSTPWRVSTTWPVIAAPFQRMPTSGLHRFTR